MRASAILANSSAPLTCSPAFRSPPSCGQRRPHRSCLAPTCLCGYNGQKCCHDTDGAVVILTVWQLPGPERMGVKGGGGGGGCVCPPFAFNLLCLPRVARVPPLLWPSLPSP